jgi:protoporphyrin/coproporphyrin ferrochelatase
MEPFDAVLVVSFGGPDGPADVRPFLANVLRSRRIPPERVEEVAKHYEMFGGVSPLTAITRRQVAGLQSRLAARGLDVPVYLGMRNWHPLLPDTLRTMSLDGVRRAVGFICAAHRSYSSCTQYRQNVIDARAELVAAGRHDIPVIYVGDWHMHDGFIEANAAHVAAAREVLPADVRSAARLVFTAHSIPLSMSGTATYQRQLNESAALVAARAGMPDWVVVYQSRSGRPQDPWLGPDITDFLRAERARGLSAVVISPLGFLCDHIEAALACQVMGLPMARAAAVNDHPRFLDTMADAVTETWRRYESGRALPLVSLTPPERTEGPPVHRGSVKQSN